MNPQKAAHIYPCQWSFEILERVSLILRMKIISVRWCHIRYLNPQEKDAQRIKKTDRKMVEELNYQGVEFPIATKHYDKIEEQNSINVNVFGYEDKQF